MTSQRPAVVCHALLAALDASEGRRRRRKRDSTPDAVGMTIKRQLLSQAVMDDPDPEMFEAWPVRQCLAEADSASMGAMRAMASEILAEWGLARTLADFWVWLGRDAPSEDRI